MALYTCEKCGRVVLVARLVRDAPFKVGGKCPDCGWELGKSVAEKSNWWLYSRTLMAFSMAWSVLFLLIASTKGLSEGFMVWLLGMSIAVLGIPLVMWAKGDFVKRGGEGERRG